MAFWLLGAWSMLNITVICEKVRIFKHCPLSFLSGSWNWAATAAELVTEQAETAEHCGMTLLARKCNDQEHPLPTGSSLDMSLPANQEINPAMI